MIDEKFLCDLLADRMETPVAEIDGRTIIPEAYQRELVEAIVDTVRVHLGSFVQVGLRVNDIVKAVKQLGG